VAAVTELDATASVAELMQRLCRFAVDQMTLSGCALVLMSGPMCAGGPGPGGAAGDGRYRPDRGPSGHRDDRRAAGWHRVQRAGPAARSGVRERAPGRRRCPRSRVSRILGNGRIQRSRPAQPLHLGDHLGI